MKKLGYIISKRKIKNLPCFVGLVSQISEIQDPTKPFIVIGLNEAKEYFGEKFKIYRKEINNNQFWTFGKTERRIDYDNDISLFCKTILNNTLKNIKYYYINILTIKRNKIKKLLEIIYSAEQKYIYIYGDMIYIYYKDYVMGISLKMCEYCGLNTKKIITRIKQNKNNILSYNDSFIGNDMRNTIRNKKYATAYFMSMKD